MQVICLAYVLAPYKHILKYTRQKMRRVNDIVDCVYGTDKSVFISNLSMEMTLFVFSPKFNRWIDRFDSNGTKYPSVQYIFCIDT